MENIKTNDIDFFLTSNKINFLKKILPRKFDERYGDIAGAILYKFASHYDNDVIYNLYIYNTCIDFEYEDNNFFTYPGPYTIDIIDGFWENMSSQNKNLIFNLVLYNYNNPRKLNNKSESDDDDDDDDDGSNC